MFGSELRCPKCNQYIPDRCTCDQWQSNAFWPKECYQGIYGDGVSTDKHRNKEAAINVCSALEGEGFGGMGEHYPIMTWVTKVGEGNDILKSIHTLIKLEEIVTKRRAEQAKSQQILEENLEAARKTIEELEKARIVPDEKLKERFDI